MIKQNGPSIDTTIGVCVYHRDDGRVCPGGIFVSKNEIPEDCRTTPFNYIAQRIKSIKKSLNEDNVSLIKDLQDAHDQSSRYTVEVARRSFTEVASVHNLSPDRVNELRIWNK